MKAKPHHGHNQTDPTFYSQCGRFEPGRSSHDRFSQWALTLTLSGAMRGKMNGVPLNYRCGDLVLTAPGTDIWWQVPVHDADKKKLSATANVEEPVWAGVWAIFHPRPHWYAWLHLPEVTTGCMLLNIEGTTLFDTMARLLLLCDKMYRSAAPDREARAMLILEWALLALHTQSRPPIDERVQRALAFIDNHYAQPLNIESIARASHLSASHLSTLFVQQVGASPIQVLEQVRLQRAQEMLRLSFATVKEIAHAVGYRTPSYFIHRFRQYNGLTPRQFRTEGSKSAGFKPPNFP